MPSTLAIASAALLSTVASIGFLAARKRASRKSPRVAALRERVLREEGRVERARLRRRAAARALRRAKWRSSRKASIRAAVAGTALVASVGALWAVPGAVPEARVSHGTGFKVAEGFAVTNDHVAGSCGKIEVEVRGGYEEVKLVTTDETNDVAVITLPEDAPGEILPFRSFPAVGLGESVHSVGFPKVTSLRTGARMHGGNVSGLTGYGNSAADFQFSGELFGGNSGSPLLDENGNVVGIAKAMLGNSAGFNFATRASTIENLLRAVRIDVREASATPWDPRTAEATVLPSVFVVRCSD